MLLQINRVSFELAIKFNPTVWMKMRFDFPISLLIIFRNNEKIYRLFLKFHMQFNLILKLSIKEVSDLLYPKNNVGFPKKISVNFGFLATTSLGKIKGRPHLSGEISITFFTA